MKICISIGHGKSARGGYDSGALGGNYQEFKIGREIGKYIGEIFKGYDCKADVINYDATLYLTERGVKVVGTDAWSWDAPFSHTARRWAETRDPAIIWEGHKAGRIRPYYQIEKLTNLAAIPATGFTFSCFPVKIERASAGWIRAVALIDEA